MPSSLVLVLRPSLLDLHSGAPFWLLAHGLPTEPVPLGANADCEVAIVGGGITGALVADALTAAGIDTLLLDRRIPGLGSTAASTALLQYELDVELHELVERVGEHAAVRAYQLGVAALDRAEQLAGELAADCGFERRASLYLASRKRHRARIAREYGARARHGFEVRLLDAAEVDARFGFPSHGALWSAQAAQLDPLGLTRALLARAVRRGARIHGRTTVVAIDTRSAGAELRSAAGHRVRAKRLVLCPGYEMPPPLQADMVALHSTFALVTEPLVPLGAWARECVVWESARPYFYMRGTPDGRVIAGGQDLPFRDPAWRDRMLPGRVDRLRGRLTKMLGGTEPPVAFAWAGTFAQTADGMPLIGPVPGLNATWAALGYGGNGITFSIIAAEMVRKWCVGEPDEDAGVFRLDR